MRIIVVLFFVLVSNAVYANGLTGIIHTLHVNLQSNRAHIYLDGKPNFDGGGCATYWTGNSLDDTKFMQYVWPLLLTAYTKNDPITVNVSGCLDGYPQIISVDILPRE